MAAEEQAHSNKPYVFEHFKLGYVGFAIPWAWVFELAHRRASASSSYDNAAVLFLMLAAGMLFFVALRKFSKGGGVEKLLHWPMAILAAISIVLISLPHLGVTVISDVVGFAVAGVAGAFMYLSWVPFYSSVDLRSAVACAFASMVVSSVLKFALDVMPLLLGNVCLIALPLCLPYLLNQASANIPPKDTPLIYFGSARQSFPYLVLLGVAVCAFVIGVAPAVSPNAVTEPIALFSFAQQSVSVLAALAVLWWVFAYRGKLHFTNTWRAIVIIVSTALLFLPNIDSELAGWALVLVGVAQAILVAVLWCMLADVAHHSSANRFTVFGFAWVCYALPLALGRLAGGLLANLDNVVFVIALLSYALTVTGILSLNERNFIESQIFRDLDMPETGHSMYASIDEGCEHLGARYKLTGREVEVLKLLCKGRSKSYIAETLVISENTVRSHARHIYRKLDVHSKQDVMDMISEKKN